MTITVRLNLTSGRYHTSRWQDLDAAARFLARKLGTFGMRTSAQAPSGRREWLVYDAAGGYRGKMEEEATRG